MRKVTTMLMSKNEKIRKEVIYRLSTNHNNPNSLNLAIQCLSDSSWEVRYYAVDTLISIGDVAVDSLIRVLGDCQWQARMNAIRALGEIGNSKAVLPICQRLCDKEAVVRYYAAKALGHLADPESIPFLLKALKDSEGYVRWRSVWALGKIGDRSVIPRLLPMLKDDYWRARVVTLNVLCQMRACHLVPKKTIQKLLKNGNIAVKKAVLQFISSNPGVSYESPRA